MEQYLTHTDYALWEVIVNGDALVPIASASAGAEGPIPLKTAEQKLARKNELKAKSTLLLAIPDEHLLKFHACNDAKSLWEAIKNRFGGNKESKKMKKSILKQNYENFAASSQEGLDKTYDKFQKLINNSSSTNEIVNTAYSVSAASSKDQASTASYADDVMFSFFSNQSNVPQLDYKDLEQIDADDLAEIYLKWQVVMLTMRVKRDRAGAPRNQGNRNRDAPRRNAPVDTSTTNALVVQDGIVNTARVNNVTTTGPKSVVSAAEGNRENVVKSSACWIWRPTRNVIDHISKDSGSYMLKRFNYVDLTRQTQVSNGLVPKRTNPLTLSSRYSWVFFLATNDETSGILKTFITGIENQINHKVKIIRCDNGTEFKNNDMNQFCGMKGIKREFSVARTPQQNRVAKRKNRTLIEAARTMLADSLLPTTFWAEAVNTACYVQNRVLVTKPHNKTPYELLHGRPPSISFMRPFGCPVTILNTLDPLGKFDGKANEGFLVGYSINSKAFRVFNTRTRKVEENLHITFLENKPNVAGSGPDWLFDIDLLTNSMNYEPVTAGNQTNRNAGIKDNVDAVPTQQYILLPLLYDSPQSLEDAVADDAGKKTNEKPANKGERNGQEKEGGASNKEGDQNVQDFRAELDNLLVQQKEGYATSTNRVSTISPSVSAAGQSFDNADDLPTDPLMPDLEDTADLLNTVLIRKPETQDHLNDQIIGDINSATQTRRMTKIFEEHALMDVKSAFLYGTIEEEVYVCQPPGFEDPQFPDKVYKVEKALYGLHQAPRAWYETLSTYLLKNRFRRGTIDKALFIKKDNGDIMLVQVYVDDIIFGSTKKSLCVEFEHMMHRRFQISSMGELTFFLGLQKFDFATMKTTSTPIETNKALLKDEEAEDVDVHLYRSMIGSLMYLTASRPDIMFVVCSMFKVPRNFTKDSHHQCC
ncbi:putative ribonuclease H-like domain-containing protein [Tanacetum coccineum]